MVRHGDAISFVSFRRCHRGYVESNADAGGVTDKLLDDGRTSVPAEADGQVPSHAEPPDPEHEVVVDLEDGSDIGSDAGSGTRSSLTLTEDGSVDESAWEPFSEWASGELLGCNVRSFCAQWARSGESHRS